MKVHFPSLLAACFAAATHAVVPAQADEMPVASIMATSGQLAFVGVPVNNGIRLAIEQANQAGVLGSAKIKLIEGDYAGDKGQIMNLANQAIKRDRVLFAFGPTTSPDSIAVGPVFNENKTVMFSLATSNGILDTGPWSFKFQQSAQDQFPLLGKHVLEKTPIRKMAIVYDRTNEGQMDQKNVFREAFKAGGGAVVTEESVGSNDTNFAPLVTKILSLDVDAVFLSLYAEQGGNLMVQLRQAGLPAKVRFIGNTAIASPRVLAIAGKAAEGTLVMSEYITGIPRNKSFEAAYKARYNIEPDSWAAGGYAMGQIGVRALKDAGPNPTPEKVRNAFMNIRDVPVPVGSGVWNHKDRKPSFGAVILVVADGKFVVAP